MYDLIIRTTEMEMHTTRYYGRDIAEKYFEMAYCCDNVYAVDLINAETGEVKTHEN